MKLKLYTTVFCIFLLTEINCQDSVRTYIPEPKEIVQEDVGAGLNIGGVKGKGEIYGKITDEKGNPIPFAQVVVIEDFEGLKPTTKGTKCNINGEYSMKALAPGLYNIMVKAISFEKVIETRIHVKDHNKTEVKVEMEKSKKIICCIGCCGMSRRKQSKNTISQLEKAMVVNKDELFQFYPNPSIGYLYIEPPKNAYLIEIFDVNGKLIYKNELKDGTGKIEIDLHPFHNGIYFINCQASGNKKYFEKLELQK